jgi:hypothetical protein
MQQPAGVIDRNGADNSATNQKQNGIEQPLTPHLIGCISSTSQSENARDRKQRHQARNNRLERFQ